MKRYSGIVGAGLIMILICAQEPLSADALFFEANHAYQGDRFDEAIGIYQKLIRNGYGSGHIYYNLGNAYLRIGDLGKAILSYERARLLIPRDADLIFNLSYARSKILDVITNGQGSPPSAFLGLDSVSLYEAFFAFTLLNAGFFGVLCVRRFYKTEWSYYLSIFLGILICVGIGMLGLKWYITTSDDRAIVLAKEIDVRAGPDLEETLLFKVHEGSTVHRERSEGKWVLLHLSKDKRGWTQLDKIERIAQTKG